MPMRHAVAQGMRFSAVLFIDASSSDRDRNEAPQSVSVEYMLTTHTCAAVVRNSLDGPGIGVEFLDLDPLDRARIQAFVEQHQTPDSSGD